MYQESMSSSSVLKWQFSPHFFLLLRILGTERKIGKIFCLMVSITKFLMVTSSLCTYLSHNRHAITWVSNNYYRYMLFAHQLHTLQWLPLQCFLQISKLMKSATDVFAQKKFSKSILSPKFAIDMVN